MKKSCWQDERYFWREHEKTHCRIYKGELKNGKAFADFPSQYPNKDSEILPYSVQLGFLKKRYWSEAVPKLIEALRPDYEPWHKAFFKRLLDRAAE